MRMLRALRHRSIALLWGGQALSAIGDEIYRVALIWLAVHLIGERAGYLAAAQHAALLATSLLAGHWADAWDQRATMIRVDAARALIVLVPVAAQLWGGLSLAVLLATALLVSGLGAFFDPALQACLPDVSPDPESLQAANGLMGTTSRLARAVGPAIMALLARLVPTIHFFTLDAASFAVSAWSIASLPPARPSGPRPRPGLREGLAAAWRSIGASPGMPRVVAARVFVAAVWNLAYGLALALRVAALAPGNVRAFGSMVACYGAGNVLGALFVGNMRRSRHERIVFAGYLCLGTGFVAMGLASSLPWLGAACLLAS
ncbi:MAG TPA: MFS transporter, partial [Elusimicrobiota bacterium]|nr:MFS transporter [Elusimicrobiota bacterium]